MKLKTISSVMVLLGIFSTSGYAVPQAPSNSTPALPLMSSTDQAFWYNLIDRNADFTGPVVFGVKNNISGFVAPSLNYQSKRTDFSSDPQNSKGYTSLTITNPELYFDSQVADWALAHVAMTYSNDFTNTSNYGNNDMFFTEANVTLQNFTQGGYFWTKIGSQYLNFGGDHSDLFTNPLTYNFSQTNAPAVTVGVVNLKGFYADGFAYNGAIVTNSSAPALSPSQQDKNNTIRGYGLDLGYVYGTVNNGFNLVVDYLADFNTTLLMQWNNYNNRLFPSKQIPATAIDAYYHIGPWAFDASYVGALTRYDSTQLNFNNAGAKPAAYALEADYNFGVAHPQSFALGYQQSQGILGLNLFGGSFPIPKTRYDFTYFYTIINNMTLNFEVQLNENYGAGDSMNINNSRTTLYGTGNNTGYAGIGYKLIF